MTDKKKPAKTAGDEVTPEGTFVTRKFETVDDSGKRKEETKRLRVLLRRPAEGAQ